MSLASLKIGKKIIEFHEQFMMIDSDKIPYEIIEGISYLLTNTRKSIYFIPITTASAFDIKIKTKDKTFKIKDSSTDFMMFESEGRKQCQENFAKLIHILNLLVKPHILGMLLNQISNNGFIKIGNLKITKSGLERPRLFRSPEVLPLREYFNSQLSEGFLYVFKNVNEKPKNFYTCQMSEMNSVIVPDLMLSLLKAG